MRKTATNQVPSVSCGGAPNDIRCELIEYKKTPRPYPDDLEARCPFRPEWINGHAVCYRQPTALCKRVFSVEMAN